MFSSSVSRSVSSGSESESAVGIGIEVLLSVHICGLPCRCLGNISL